MNENFTIIWSFRNRLEVLKKSIETADKTCDKNVDFCLVDAASNDETIKGLREFVNTIPNRIIRICESSYRTSLSQAWNLGMMLTNNRYVIFASSDTFFINSGWQETLKHSIIDNGNEYVLIENHAVFGFDKKAILKMGWFDESFVPGPHFDVDFMIRASENNVRFSSVANANYYTHAKEETNFLQVRTSTEVEDRLPMHDKTNENIFRSKWISNWPGWIPVNGNPNHLHHPPTHISQVRRSRPEIDPHPIYTSQLK